MFSIFWKTFWNFQQIASNSAVWPDFWFKRPTSGHILKRTFCRKCIKFVELALYKLWNRIVFFIFFIKAIKHSRNHVKLGLMRQFHNFWAVFSCRYWRHLLSILSTLTITHLEKNEKQHSISHTLNSNSWKFWAFSSKNDSVRHSNVFLSMRKGKISFQNSLKQINASFSPMICKIYNALAAHFCNKEIY